MKLHQKSFEKGACGFGLLVNLTNRGNHLIKSSLLALKRILHRGAIASDGLSGDGCGISISMPYEFFASECKKLNIEYNKNTIVGQMFLSTNQEIQTRQINVIKEIAEKKNFKVEGYRTVPIVSNVCGSSARTTIPYICQFFLKQISPSNEQQELTRLYKLRKLIEHRLRGDEDFYICSLSNNLVCYKALVLPNNLEIFFPDLQNKMLEASICLIHQRFATNTVPRWRLAQPLRHLVHNGEINTINGNRFWFQARTPKFLTGELRELLLCRPLFNPEESDSASLDELISLLIAGGMDILTSLRIAIPPAWANQPRVKTRERSFYEYYSMIMEPWDGPASIAFTDGRYGACIQDRNGLRPARWVLTKNNTLVVASEAGVCDFPTEDIISKGKLNPGEMLVADTKENKILTSNELFKHLDKDMPYAKWLKEEKITIIPDSGKVFTYRPLCNNDDSLDVFTKLYGVTHEEIDSILKPLATGKNEAVGSMGDDTPLPILSLQNRSIFDCFRQQFAQVTNPPIDSLREGLVMSLETSLGPEYDFFTIDKKQVRKVIIRSPLLSHRRFADLLSLHKHHQDEEVSFKTKEISLNVSTDINLETALNDIIQNAISAVKSGHQFLLLTDRNTKSTTYPVHALLATGAVHQALLEAGLRTDCSLIIDTAVIRDSHHLAVMIGYGANAVFPYLAYELIYQKFAKQDSKLYSGLAHGYRKAMNKGLFKILSKMGISTIASYRSSKLFEIIGFDKDLTNLCFKGTPSRIAGCNFDDLYQDMLQTHSLAYNKTTKPSVGGLLKYVDGGEYHAFNPDVVRSLQVACNSGNYQDYQKYSKNVNNRKPTVLRDLLNLKFDSNNAIAIEEVEPIKNILPRFDSAGMSLGALSPEAHSTLAKAMNSIKGRSNSGEGGEDSSRYGTDAESKIKQVASGRFGVTPYYLRNAEVLQIKIAQGAKPGEGGQLPGDKVNAMIATLRHSMPGVSLISPPPHHDIYSIEDLAQLIFDLKQINPDCLVSVKLVSEAGVGTIAAGVAKAYADFITIAGYDGGTGASPLSSVKYAGTPWELGLPETHQLLVANGLRKKVRLQVDGGLKTGLDIIKGAILGAESFGFGTAPMIAMGCKYLRICHLNNCATGIATQHEKLRSIHFHGKVQMVINFFRFVATEAREIMAQLGVKKLTDLIGRTDLLEALPGITDRQSRIDFSGITAPQENHFFAGQRNNSFDKGELAEKMVVDSNYFIKQCESNHSAEKILSYNIKNYNRSIGARVSGEITKQYGNAGLGKNRLVFNFKGTAGQSFGTWNTIGMHLNLEGDANDYVGKGLYGGVISLKPPVNSNFKSQDTIIAGNTCLYGATGGKLFASGKVGERFAVRNSGAVAVVEGSGNHCCEYMTGGMVVVLGKTGVNFAAGMTGGMAFCYDNDKSFVDRYNNELVDIKRIDTEGMSNYQLLLQSLIKEHVIKTGSTYAEHILETFSDEVNDFWLVIPKAADLQELINSLHRAA